MKLLKLAAIIMLCLVFSTGIEAQNRFFDLRQPDGTAFSVKEMGVCWLSWYETPEGYMVQKGKDQYYHYVTIDQNGDFVHLPQRAGKDRTGSVPVRPYQNPAVRAALAEKVQAYNDAADENRARFLEMQRRALGRTSANKRSVNSLNQLADPLTLEVGVILVEFTDITHFSGGNRPDGYFVSDFENMLFSDDSYITSPFGNPNGSPLSPDDEVIFGSMRDYFEFQSHGILTVTGHVVNPTNPDGTPRWINLGVSVESYPDYAGGVAPHYSIYEDAINAAIDSSWDANQDMHIIILAGSDQDGPFTGGTGFPRFYFSENNFDPSFDFDNWFGAAGYHERNSHGESGGVTFTHIGIFAHEAFHVMGWGLTNVEGTGTTIYLHPAGSANDWSMMYTGARTGPLRKWECPSDLDPVARIMMEWAEPTDVSTNLSNETVTYVEQDDDVNEPLDFYRFDDPYSNEEFIIENRQFSGFNSYLPQWWESGSHGGLLFWRHASATSQARNLRPADNVFDGSQVPPDPHWAGGDAGDPFPGDTDNTAISPYTTPNSNSGVLGAGSFTGIAVTDISSTATNMTADLYSDYQPAPPQNLDISNPGEDGEHPILVWDANTEPDLDHYLVWRGWTPNWKTTFPTWEQNPAASVTGTTWTDNWVFIDLDVLSATYYRLTAVDDADNESDYSNQTSTTSGPIAKPVAEEQQAAASQPERFALHQNYPNPFNPHTQIRFDVPERAHVTLKIYNLLGEEVRSLVDGVQGIGFHTIVWDGTNDAGALVASGTYLVRFVAGNFVGIQKVAFVK